MAGNAAVLTLANVASTAGVLVDTTPTSVVQVLPMASAVYGPGQTLTFDVLFNRPVTVDTTGGTPYLQIGVGATQARAAYSAGSGTRLLTFAYVVQPGDEDADGITIDSLQANGPTLRDVFGQDAVLTLAGVGSTAGLLVDAVGPTVALTARMACRPAPSP